MFDECSAAHSGSLELTMECVASWVEGENAKLQEAQANSNAAIAGDMTSWLLVLAGGLVFVMQAGFAMVCAGAIRKKNTNNTMRA